MVLLNTSRILIIPRNSSSVSAVIINQVSSIDAIIDSSHHLMKQSKRINNIINITLLASAFNNENKNEKRKRR